MIKNLFFHLYNKPLLNYLLGHKNFYITAPGGGVLAEEFPLKVEIRLNKNEPGSIDPLATAQKNATNGDWALYFKDELPPANAFKTEVKIQYQEIPPTVRDRGYKSQLVWILFQLLPRIREKQINVVQAATTEHKARK